MEMGQSVTLDQLQQFFGIEPGLWPAPQQWSTRFVSPAVSR